MGRKAPDLQLFIVSLCFSGQGFKEQLDCLQILMSLAGG